MKLSVPLRFPATEGLKETVIVHVPPFAARGVAQLSLSIKAEGLVVILATVATPAPILVITIGPLLRLPTLAVSGSEFGEIDKNVPTPLSVIDCIPALSITLSVPGN